MKTPKLIVIRGNSGSGKTTLAKTLQQAFGRNTMLISQDMVRIQMLNGKDAEALPLLTELLRYGRQHSDVTILEGILVAEHYLPLFQTALAEFGVREYDAQGEEILDKILSAMISEIDGKIERYVLIAFDSDRNGRVNTIKGIIPAKGLDYYKEENWTSYIMEEYTMENEMDQEFEISESAILLQRKPKIKRVHKKEDPKKNENK